jgi:RNA processing factor Prp31
MASKTKGGRGKKAPYKTGHYRIPQPIKPTVEVLANQYRELVTNNSESEAYSMLERVSEAIVITQKVENKTGTNFSEANLEQVVDILQEALKLKANAGGAIKERIKQVLAILDKS